LCNIAVTNSCNATFEFCNFARGKVLPSHLRWIDADRFASAIDILYTRGIRYVSFFGGEPLTTPTNRQHDRSRRPEGDGHHRHLKRLTSSSIGRQACSSWLKTIYVSIDAATVADHEANRGLKGVCGRIRAATSRIPTLGMTAIAQVTMSKLISDYQALISFLRDLGFTAVAFSYPQRARLSSSSLAWSNSSRLVDFTNDELADAFDKIKSLRSAFAVDNPEASVPDLRQNGKLGRHRTV